MKKFSNYSKFKRKPLKIIKGTSNGPDKASAILVDGDTADIKVPNAKELCTTRLIIIKHITNLSKSLFKLVIQ